MLQQIIFGLLITQFTSNLLTFGIWQYLVHSTFCAGSGWILTKTIIKWFSYDLLLPHMSPTFPTKTFVKIFKTIHLKILTRCLAALRITIREESIGV